MSLGLYLAIGTVISCIFSLLRQEGIGDFIKRLTFISAINVIVWYFTFGSV